MCVRVCEKGLSVSAYAVHAHKKNARMLVLTSVCFPDFRPPPVSFAGSLGPVTASSTDLTSGENTLLLTLLFHCWEVLT